MSATEADLSGVMSLDEWQRRLLGMMQEAWDAREKGGPVGEAAADEYTGLAQMLAESTRAEAVALTAAYWRSQMRED